MKNKYFIIILIFLLFFYFLGYWLGSKESFAINCFSKGLVPMITPNNYEVCWNKTQKYDDFTFGLDIIIGGIENGT